MQLPLSAPSSSVHTWLFRYTGAGVNTQRLSVSPASSPSPPCSTAVGAEGGGAWSSASALKLGTLPPGRWASAWLPEWLCVTAKGSLIPGGSWTFPNALCFMPYTLCPELPLSAAFPKCPFVVISINTLFCSAPQLLDWPRGP